jgi:predicted thioesterase
MAIEIGASATVERGVEPEMTADRWGNTGVFVLATPTLVGLLEMTCGHAIHVGGEGTHERVLIERVGTTQ